MVKRTSIQVQTEREAYKDMHNCYEEVRVLYMDERYKFESKE